jgi:putative flippase GtrA
VKPDLSNDRYQAAQEPTGLRVTGTPVKFVMVGALNTIVGLAVIYAAKWMGVDDAPANAMGYAVGLCVSFVLNKSWTFAYGGPAAPAFAKFLVVIGIAYLLNLATVLGAIRVLHVNGYLAQALGIVPYTLCTYFASRDFAFRLR